LPKLRPVSRPKVRPTSLPKLRPLTMASVEADRASFVQQRVVAVNRPTRLVCRWQVTKNKEKAAATYARGMIISDTSDAGQAQTVEANLPPSSKLLVEPQEATGRLDMAAGFRSWRLLRLPLCQEAMATLIRGKPSSSSRARAGGSRAGIGAARLLHVVEADEARTGADGVRLGSGDNYHDEGALPTCDGGRRVDALVAVSLAAWSSSAAVADVLSANLPQSSGVLPQPRSRRSFDNLTVVQVISRDLEAALLLSPYPKRYPASKTVAIGDGFYTEYRQYCALSQRARELADYAAGAGGSTTYESIGESYAGRDIYAIRINGGAADGPAPERRVLVLGGQHAREWISPAAVTYAAEVLSAALAASRRRRAGGQPRPSNVRADAFVSPAALAALERVEVVFVPIVNPDGFERTYVSTSTEQVDRFWRKNTRPTDGEGNGDASCSGTRGKSQGGAADPV